LFLGIPFLIDCAISTANLERKRKMEKKKLLPRSSPDRSDPGKRVRFWGKFWWLEAGFG
jgi:hypothetical protein